jgi:hypothetical protein
MIKKEIPFVIGLKRGNSLPIMGNGIFPKGWESPLKYR